jgi:pantetheine-phosphate adenylyltransferase
VHLRDYRASTRFPKQKGRPNDAYAAAPIIYRERLHVKEKIGIYPGSFDPITNGHLDILERGLELFDTLIIAIAFNIDKRGLFTVDERKELIRQSVKQNDKIIIDSFEGLTADYIRKVNARFVIRGLRAMSDFESEFQMASMNRNLNCGMDTIFMMTSKDYFFVSSRTVKEVASFGGSVKGCVPEVVADALRKKFGR